MVPFASMTISPLKRLTPRNPLGLSAAQRVIMEINVSTGGTLAICRTFTKVCDIGQFRMVLTSGSLGFNRGIRRYTAFTL
jgi:hypothetical protein